MNHVDDVVKELQKLEYLVKVLENNLKNKKPIPMSVWEAIMPSRRVWWRRIVYMENKTLIMSLAWERERDRQRENGSSKKEVKILLDNDRND